ncbi:uncharacterized protein LOC111121567 [Crassostrea virginica]
MAVSPKVYFAGILLVVIIIISYEGASAQVVECAKRPFTCLSNLKTTGEKKEICESAEAYLSCMDKALNDCGLEQDVMKKAKDKVKELDCSGAGLPVISFVCLLMAAILHKLF